MATNNPAQELQALKARVMALEGEPQSLRSILDHNPAVTYRAKGSGDFAATYISAGITAQLGYQPSDFTENSEFWTDHLHPEDKSRVLAEMAQAVDNGSGVFEYRFRHQDGTCRWMRDECHIAAEDEAPEVIGYSTDITERRRLREQLLHHQRLESVGQLAGGVAHNFNNALTAIYGYAELLARRFEATDPARKDLEQIQRVAEQSASLTRQLLAFSRKDQVQPSVFCLNDAIESERNLLSPLIGDHVRIGLQLDRTLPDVRCDRRQMEQVIMNLVLNARDAMPDGGALTIISEATDVDEAGCRANPEAVPGRYVRLTVIDTGTGMDEETVARVFEPFYTTKEPGEGVGLGLAMVYGAVRQSGGFATVQSEVGMGSTFALYIPAQEQSG